MKYRDLTNADAQGFFGHDDRLGTLNLQQAETVVQAASLISTGDFFSLNGPLDWPDPPLFNRKAVKHTVYQTDLDNRDDYLDSFYPQASSQWDSFQHFKDPETGFYNHLPPEALGIDHWAARGIVGRAVLLDVQRSFLAEGRDIHWRTRSEISVNDLESIRLAAGIEKRRGDILLIRTGWVTSYNAASSEERALLRAKFECPGLASNEAMAEYLWDWGVSAIAADNVGLEALPTDGHALHAKLLGRLGMPIGELWWLDELAAHSAADGRYESFLTSAPLNIRGGVGSPANAIAIK